MDVAVRKLVSGRLNLQTAGPHPEPELLTAFAERSTTAAEREGLLQHLAACADCRKVLYLAAPDAAETQAAFARNPRRPRFAVRWATLAASVVILGSVLITDRGMFTRHSAAPASGVLAPAAGGASSTVSENNAPAADQTTQPAEAARSQRYQAPLKHMTAKPQAAMQFDNSGEVHFAAPHPATAVTTGAANARALDVQPAAAAWSLSPNGLAQRSFDSGKSWQTVTVENGLVFKAVNSVGDNVWLGGDAGSLYHSADAGQSWSKVEPTSGGEKLISNITRIEFSDSQNGFLVTGDGHVWSTSNAGKDWRLK